MSGKDSNEKDGKQSIDLSSLQTLDFGPDWLQSSETGSSRQFSSGSRDGRARPSRDARTGGSSNRDRRAGGAPARRSEARGEREGRGRRFDRGRDRGEGGFQRRSREVEAEAFRPVVDVLFYPEDDPFRALCKAMRHSLRTYELFEIARLILEKPERFVVVLKARDDANSPIRKFHLAVPAGLPFESEEEAVEHVLLHHLDQFFKVETVEAEKPKGSFQVVSRCGVTGDVLGPPNYHRYQQLLHDHHARKVRQLSFEQFVDRLQSVREPEVIESWLEKMTQKESYTALEGDASFDSLEAVRHYLLTQRRDAVVTEAVEVRFSGKLLEQLPQGLIRQSAEAEWLHQKKFPLHTANNLRGRLRRMKFNIHKRGLKSISYVCGIKRKFRDETTVFSDSLGSLLDFIDQHPNLPLRDLPERYLGIATKELAERDPATQSSDITEPQAAVLEQEKTGNAPASDEAIHPQEAETVSPPQSLTSETDEARIRHLMSELHWLVSEGYVTEFSDGRLFANPVQPSKKPSAATTDARRKPEKDHSAKDPVVTEGDPEPESPPESVS